MNTSPAKQSHLDTPEAVAEQRAQQRVEPDDREDASQVGLLRITRPLDINSDELGGDPYNSTGRFSRIKGK